MLAAIRSNADWEAFLGGVRRNFEHASGHAVWLGVLVGAALVFWLNLRLARWLVRRFGRG